MSDTMTRRQISLNGETHPMPATFLELLELLDRVGFAYEVIDDHLVRSIGDGVVIDHRGF